MFIEIMENRMTKRTRTTLTAGAVVITALLAGCAARQMVVPDLRIAREIPTEAALSWLKRAVTIAADVSGRVCAIDEKGIRARAGHAAQPFTLYRSLPYVVGGGGLISTDLGYAVYITETRDALAGWVVVTRKDAGVLGSGDECYVYNREVNGAAAERELATVKSEVERTLSALAALGVEVEKSAPGKTQ